MSENEKRARYKVTRTAAKETTDAELDAARAKTIRLKAERLAKEAASAENEPTPAASKKGRAKKS
jgi:hypothetical protein